MRVKAKSGQVNKCLVEIRAKVGKVKSVGRQVRQRRAKLSNAW